MTVAAAATAGLQLLLPRVEVIDILHIATRDARYKMLVLPTCANRQQRALALK